MHPYAIGLDIGIKSVGWAVVALDQNEGPCGILDMGSRIFDAAEHPKTGASPAAPRREARSTRRCLRRHRHRNERIRSLLISSGVVTHEENDTLFSGTLSDIYTLRVNALDQPVTGTDFARILIHLAQRRGFRSNRKNAAAADDGKLLEAVNKNKQRMDKNRYRTVAEMMVKDPEFAACKRNKGGDYRSTVTRDMVEDEVHQLFAAQRSFERPFATKALEHNYLEILLSQRSFDEGPGGNSPYGGDQIAKMVGICTLEKALGHTCQRAAKASYSFEYFTLLENLNHLRLIKEGNSAPLSEVQRRTVIELAHKTDALTFAKLRKALAVSSDTRFNLVRYHLSDSREDAETKTSFRYLKAYHTMRTALEKAEKGSFARFTADQRDDIATALTLYRTSSKIAEYLSERGFSAHDIELIETIGSFSKFGHISVTACKAIIPHLEQGMSYSDACTAAGYPFKAHENGEKTLLLHLQPDDLESITSPVVRRAVSQTAKVINAIIRREGGSPTYINIELAREMAKDFKERKQLEKENEANKAANERVMNELRELGLLSPTGQDLLKLKLFKEQDGRCAYSLAPLSIERLFEPGYAEIDHIVPYSISFDDSFANKALVTAKANRDKGNRLPLQYLQGQARDEFTVWVTNQIKNRRKRDRLLKETITPEEETAFKERNLQDTKTMSRFLLNYIRDNLQFAPSAHRRARVNAVNGAVTSYMRKRWGLTKIRENGDLHHAVDALVIACTTQGMIAQISRYASLRECEYVHDDTGSMAVNRFGEVLKRFPYPWPWFRKEVEARLATDPARRITELKLPFYLEDEIADRVHPLFVSRMPHRKVSGAAHKDTVRSLHTTDNGNITVVKTALTSLKLGKDGEIVGYFKPESDRLLYEALKARLTLFGGNAAKAFAEPFFKPKKDGSQGPRVDKVKIYETSVLSVPVHGGTGVADHDSMIRLDIFHVENDGYYMIPIYVADTLKPELPQKACVAHKGYGDWKLMSDEDFLFSLYPNDLIRVTHKQGIKLSKTNKQSTLPDTREVISELLYYIGADRSSAAISAVTHDNAYKIRGLGIKTLTSIEKYAVDVLGEYHLVKKETRQPFQFKKKKG